MVLLESNNTQYIEQKLYNDILNNIPIACVDIAVIVDGSILLVRRKDAPAKGEWWLPGGRIFKGETMKDAAKRKALEEVGLICHVGPIVHTAETIFPDGPYGISVHSINSCFFLYPHDNSHNICLDSHHEEYKWITNIPDNIHPYVRNCLLGAGLEY